jgi:5-methyltetrahydropteroyltriglutamate--homocysteine methyltransferase
VAAGIAVPGDGEYGKSMGSKVNYPRLVELFLRRPERTEDRGRRSRQPCRYTGPARAIRFCRPFADRRDRARFAAAYADPDSGITTGRAPNNWPFCRGAGQLYGKAAIACRHRQLQGRPWPSTT